MSLAISGKTAIVTGAAHGIGLAIARHLLERGANVMFADIDEDKLIADLGEAASSEGTARYFAGDLCQKLTVSNLLSATVDAFDRIDILVNASRAFAPCDPLCTDEDVLEAMLRKNVMAGLRLSQMTAKRMIGQAQRDGVERGTPIGSIINLSSIAAVRSQPELLAYSIACAAQDQATRSLALALAPEGIRVNAVSIGSVMSASLMGAIRENGSLRAAIVEATPLGRIAAAQEVVEAVQFLASDGAGFMTGQILTVDGGRSLVDAVKVPYF